MYLKNQEIVLRAIEPNDVDIIYNWENNTEIWNVSNTLTPFSKDIIQQYVNNAHQDIFESKQLRLIICLNNEELTAIGAIDLFDFDPFHHKAGIGILINENTHRQKGIATQALQLLIDYAFKVLMLHQLYCNIGTDNSASIRLFENAGFIKTGEKLDWLKTHKGWQNEYLYQLINRQIIGNLL